METAAETAPVSIPEDVIVWSPTGSLKKMSKAAGQVSVAKVRGDAKLRPRSSAAAVGDGNGTAHEECSSEKVLEGVSSGGAIRGTVAL